MLKKMCIWEMAQKITLAGLLALAGLVVLTGCLSPKETAKFREADGKENRQSNITVEQVMEAYRKMTLEMIVSGGLLTPKVVIEENIKNGRKENEQTDISTQWYAKREASTVLYVVAAVVFVAGVIIGVIATGLRGRLIGSGIALGGIVLAVVNTVAAARPEMCLVTMVVCGIVVIGSITGFILWRAK